MRTLYKTNSRSQPYSMQSLIKALRESTSIDFTAFFSRYVDGTGIIPVGSYFDIGMLEIFNQYGIDVSGEEQRVLLEMLTFENE